MDCFKGQQKKPQTNESKYFLNAPENTNIFCKLLSGSHQFYRINNLAKKMKGMTYFVNHNLYKSWDVRGVFKRFLKYITWQWVYRNFGEIFCLRIVKKYLPIDPVSKCCLYNLNEQNNYPSSEQQISIRRIKQISRT